MVQHQHQMVVGNVILEIGPEEAGRHDGAATMLRIWETAVCLIHSSCNACSHTSTTSMPHQGTRTRMNIVIMFSIKILPQRISTLTPAGGPTRCDRIIDKSPSNNFLFCFFIYKLNFIMFSEMTESTINYVRKYVIFYHYFVFSFVPLKLLSYLISNL
jgi:hypothetical protein